MKKIFKIFILTIFLNFSVLSFANVENNEEQFKYIWIDEAIEESRNIEELEIQSRSAVVYDRTSKTVIWGKNETSQVPMASTTKIMTAIVMMEELGEEGLKQQVQVCKEAANTGGSRLGLKTNDKITYNDLLYGLMLCSGNDAAVQIAISLAGSVENFAKLMNKKAIKLDLENTHFVTPHGLDRDGHYTTAEELAKITDYALENKKIAEVVSTKEYTVTINGYPKAISNTNELLGYLEGVNGVKTGFTNGAGRCLVTSVDRDNFNIITVVLGADTKKIRTTDSIKIIEYVYKNYELKNLEELIRVEYESWYKLNKKHINIYKGVKENPEIYLEKINYKIYPVRKDVNIAISVEEKLQYEAPLEKDYPIGEMNVSIGDKLIESIKIKTVETVEKKEVKDYFIELMHLLKEIV